MDDPAFVRSSETIGDRDRVVDRLARDKRAVVERRPQCSPLQQLADDVWSPVVSADVVDGENVGMIQGCCRPGLLVKAPQPIDIQGISRQQNLDRDLTVQSIVLRPIDLPHSTLAEQAEDPVRTDTSTHGQRHLWDESLGRLYGGDCF